MFNYELRNVAATEKDVLPVFGYNRQNSNKMYVYNIHPSYH